MGATATFAADFSNFEQALGRATLKLREFGLEPAKVEKQLNRIGTSFSGQRLIAEATLSARAIEELGEKGGFSAGLLKLTSTELQRAGTMAKEAADKMKAMGIEVPPNIERLAKSIEPIPKHLTLADKAAGLAKSTFAQLFGAFTAANLVDKAVTTLISFGKEAFTSAGRIVDLSAKLNISTDAIQKWEHVAKQTGATLDDFSSNAFKLGTRLAGGGGSVKDAVQDLGLSFQELRNKRPEDQFDTVVAALSRMDDATKRNQLGVEIFGRNFESIAAAVAQGYEDIAKGASRSTEEQLKALDRAGDAWDAFVDRAKKNVQGFLGNLVLAGEEFDRLSLLERIKALAASGGSFAKLVEGLTQARTAREGAESLQTLKPVSSHAPLQEFVDYIARLQEAKDEVTDLTAAQKAQIDAAVKTGESIESLANEYGISETAIRMVGDAFKDGKKGLQEYAKEADALQAVSDDLFGRDVIAKANQYAKAIGAVGNVSKLSKDKQKEVSIIVNEAIAAYARLGQRAPQALHDLAEATLTAQVRTVDFGIAMRAIPSQIMSLDDSLRGLIPAAQVSGEALMGLATQGQSSILKIVKTLNSQDLTKEIAKTQGLFGSLFQGISGGFKSLIAGMTGGGGLGGFLKNLGAGITQGFGNLISRGLTGLIDKGLGALIGGLGKLFGGLFGNKEHEKVNDLRDAFIASAGGLDALNQKAHDAGVTLDRLLAAKKVKDFDAAVAALGDRFSDLDADQARLNDAIQKYGFSLEELGPKLQASRLNEQAKELTEDWRVLVAAGVDVAAVNERMAGSINEYLQSALRVGAEVPAAMRPLLESMAAQGTLIDANGNQITDLEAAGIQFAETMTQGFDRVVEKLQELIAQLNGTGSAIRNIPRSFDIIGNVSYNDPGLPGRSFTDPDVPEFAHGSGGRLLDFKNGTLVRLHNQEQISTGAEVQSQAAGLAAVRDEVAALRRDLGRQVARALADELTVTPRLRMS